MKTKEEIADAIAYWQEMMAEEAKKVNGNMEVSYALPDGGIFSMKYKPPKKK